MPQVELQGKQERADSDRPLEERGCWLASWHQGRVRCSAASIRAIVWAWQKREQGVRREGAEREGVEKRAEGASRKAAERREKTWSREVSLEFVVV